MGVFLRADFHIHSKYSYDSIMEPLKIMKICRKLGFDVISITDHNTIKGSINAKKYEKKIGVKVFIGEEVKTDLGDIIGLNLNEEIKSRSFFEVIEEIKDQGGISIFPHPFRGHKDIEMISDKVDLIEAFNSRSNIYENQKSLDLALKFNKPPVAGSDAHVYSEIGNSIMDFNKIFDHHKYIQYTYSKNYQKVMSYIIKDIKLYKFHKIPIHMVRLVL